VTFTAHPFIVDTPHHFDILPCSSLCHLQPTPFANHLFIAQNFLSFPPFAIHYPYTLPFATHPFCHSLPTHFLITFHPLCPSLLSHFTVHCPPLCLSNCFFLFTAHPFAIYCPPLLSFSPYLPRLYSQRKLFAVQCPPLCHSQLANPVDSAVDSRQQTPFWNASLACVMQVNRKSTVCALCTKSKCKRK
jgi:hypothetical protein